MKNEQNILPEEIVQSKIYLIRGKKVMLDSDLAFLYQVETKNLNKAAQRNIERFPEDFMFQLNELENRNLRSQFVTSGLRFQIGTSKKDSRGGHRYLPYVFTEQGVAMLSSVLRSGRAIQVNIQIMRTFTKIREMLATNKELREKIEELEKKYDEQFTIVFDAIKQLITEEEKPETEMGFRTG
jgi:hypothetical protein